MIKAVCFDAFGTICYVSLGRIVMFDETKEVFEMLKNRGLKVGVISNINRLYGGFLYNALPFKPDCFSVPYLSGGDKPDVLAFEYAAKELGLKPEEILMIGDCYRNDYQGAKNAGMQALFLDVRGENRTIESIANIKEVLDHEYLV